MSVNLKQGESVNLTTGQVTTTQSTPRCADYLAHYSSPAIRAYYKQELQANNLAAFPSAIYLYGEH